MRIIVGLLVVGIVGAALYYANYLRAEAPPNLRTEVVERGDLLITISATGTVEPEEIVDVGAQVVGRIQEFGMDPRAATDPEFKDKHIDYCSPVEENTVLARIDDALYLATRNQAQAGLDRAKADLIHLKAMYAQATAEWERAQRLRELKLTSLSGFGRKNGDASEPTTIKGISDSDFVLAKANYEVAKANVDVGTAAVKQQEATLESADTNLGYTTIKSPVKGTIIARRVNMGQTVVSSLNAPSLFLIAKDLRRIEVWAAVNEADIGQLKVGMPVDFTVDAFRDDVFRGQVRQIRFDAKTTNNVVTYTVVVSTNNDDLKLLPYLSADLRFEVDHRQDVLKVPNAALRYRPRRELIVPPPSGSAESSTSPGGDDPSDDAHRTVWVKQGNFVYPLEVQVGVTDGTHSEIVGGGLTEQMEVVLSENLGEVAETEANNPFAFRRPGSPKAGKKSS
ncbi:MAG: HlyD family efflux transporter periplasmic adaptor subunit [Pirellulales bacterium]